MRTNAASRLVTRPRALILAAVAAAASLAAWEPGFAGDEKPKKNDVATMDLDLLQENLLKIWIIEESSGQHNQRRIAQKSFDALISPVEPTGDPEKDKEQAALRKKLDKELRHYMLLELDGSIECVDLVDRVLGTKVTLGSVDAEKRRILAKSLPEIAWRNLSLDDALADLGKKAGVPIDFPRLPRTLQLEVSYETSAGMPLLTVLQFINSQHPIEWTFDGAGGLKVRYLGEIPTGPGGRR